MKLSVTEKDDLEELLPRNGWRRQELGTKCSQRMLWRALAGTIVTMVAILALWFIHCAVFMSEEERIKSTPIAMPLDPSAISAIDIDRLQNSFDETLRKYGGTDQSSRAELLGRLVTNILSDSATIDADFLLTYMTIPETYQMAAGVLLAQDDMTFINVLGSFFSRATTSKNVDDMYRLFFQNPAISSRLGDIISTLVRRPAFCDEIRNSVGDALAAGLLSKDVTAVLKNSTVSGAFGKMVGHLFSVPRINARIGFTLISLLSDSMLVDDMASTLGSVVRHLLENRGKYKIAKDMFRGIWSVFDTFVSVTVSKSQAIELVKVLLSDTTPDKAEDLVRRLYMNSEITNEVGSLLMNFFMDPANSRNLGEKVGALLQDPSGASSLGDLIVDILAKDNVIESVTGLLTVLLGDPCYCHNFGDFISTLLKHPQYMQSIRETVERLVVVKNDFERNYAITRSSQGGLLKVMVNYLRLTKGEYDLEDELFPVYCGKAAFGPYVDPPKEDGVSVSDLLSAITEIKVGDVVCESMNKPVINHVLGDIFTIAGDRIIESIFDNLASSLLKADSNSILSKISIPGIASNNIQGTSANSSFFDSFLSAATDSAPGLIAKLGPLAVKEVISFGKDIITDPALMEVLHNYTSTLSNDEELQIRLDHLKGLIKFSDILDDLLASFSRIMADPNFGEDLDHVKDVALNGGTVSELIFISITTLQRHQKLMTAISDLVGENPLKLKDEIAKGGVSDFFSMVTSKIDIEEVKGYFNDFLNNPKIHEILDRIREKSSSPAVLQSYRRLLLNAYRFSHVSYHIGETIARFIGNPIYKQDIYYIVGKISNFHIFKQVANAAVSEAVPHVIHFATSIITDLAGPFAGLLKPVLDGLNGAGSGGNFDVTKLLSLVDAGPLLLNHLQDIQTGNFLAILSDQKLMNLLKSVVSGPNATPNQLGKRRGSRY